MRILVNHLTRMQPGYICVAGVDVDTLEHIRPVLRRGRLTTNLLRPNGGPLDIGSVVDLGSTTYAGRPPELEDRHFDPAKAKWLFDYNPDDFWSSLEGITKESLTEIFGPALELWDESGTVDVGEGHASLGCVRPEEQPWIYADHRGTVRLVLHYLMPSVDLSVNDLRLYEGDHRMPRQDLVADIDRRLKAGVEAILSVGLTRPWRKRGDDAERHWLQVNNIHLKDNPLWRLGDEQLTEPFTRECASDAARRETRYRNSGALLPVRSLALPKAVYEQVFVRSPEPFVRPTTLPMASWW